MKRFHFPLRPVVVLRTHHELRAREVFGKAVQELNRAEGELSLARQRSADFAATLAAGRQARFSASSEGHSLAGYRRECLLEVRAERAVHGAQASLQQRRAEYIEARRLLEIIQKLETQARAAHQVALNRAEQAEFDDRGSRRVSLHTPFSR